MALDQEGVDRRRSMFDWLDDESLVVQIGDVSIPDCEARIHHVDLKSLGIKKPDWALASLAVLAQEEQIVSMEMLAEALKIRFKGKVLESSLDIIQKAGK